MRVLAFSCYYTPEIAASMYLTEDIYKGIVDGGNSLEVFVPMPTRGISKELRKGYKKKKYEEKYDGKMIIHRISMFSEGKNSILRAFRYLLINLAFICKGIKAKADVIFVQSTPPTQGMMAGIIGAIKNVPVVYNLQDIFPDSLVNTRMTSKGSLIWKIGRKVEDYTYKHAKKIIVISDDFKKNILAKGVSEEKIVVVPNWADVSGVYPIERSKNILFERYNLDPNKFYITYCGNVGFTQNMDLLLDVAKELENELPDLRFVIIGDGADKARITKKAEDEKISNIIFLPFQPYEDIAHVFSLGDAGLIISKPGVGMNSVPSKTWSIMAAAKPIIASFDSSSELCHLIDFIGCGFHADAGDKAGLINIVRKVFSCNSIYIGNKAKAYLDNELNREKCISLYLNTITC